jgi:hypothetical protein
VSLYLVCCSLFQRMCATCQQWGATAGPCSPGGAMIQPRASVRSSNLGAVMATETTSGHCSNAWRLVEGHGPRPSC